MSEEDRTTYGVELLLAEPEVVAWLRDDAQPEIDEPDDDEPLQAA